MCIISDTLHKTAPNLPPGCLWRKSVAEKPLLFIKSIANTSPKTIVAVVDDVGAKPKGQASPLSGNFNTKVEFLPNALSGFLVIAIRGILYLLAYIKISDNSLDSPL